MDYVRRFAVVALDPTTERGVAIARYEPLEEGIAEFAVAVHPAWRRVGLATALIEMLAEAALERSIHSVGASYLAANRPIAALLAHAGTGAKQLIEHGIAELAVTLDRNQVAALQRNLASRNSRS